jgi:hypothetical protein
MSCEKGRGRPDDELSKPGFATLRNLNPAHSIQLRKRTKQGDINVKSVTGQACRIQSLAKHTHLFDCYPDSSKLPSTMQCPTFLLAILLLSSIAVSDVFALPASPPNSPLTRNTCPNTFVGVCCRRYDGAKELVSEVANVCFCARLQGTVVSSQQCHPPVPCICPKIFLPVCCLRNGAEFTSTNSCMCACDGGKVIPKHKGCGNVSA